MKYITQIKDALELDSYNRINKANSTEQSKESSCKAKSYLEKPRITYDCIQTLYITYNVLMLVYVHNTHINVYKLKKHITLSTLTNESKDHITKSRYLNAVT